MDTFPPFHTCVDADGNFWYGSKLSIPKQPLDLAQLMTHLTCKSDTHEQKIASKVYNLLYGEDTVISLV